MAMGRPKINREVERLERRLREIDRGLLAYFELGRQAYRIKRKTERKLRKLKSTDHDGETPTKHNTDN